MKKLIVLTLTMLLLLAACGTAEQSTEDKSNSTNKNAASEETITKEGSFAGLADSHTIAVTIDGKETSFQVGEDLQEKVNSIGEGKSVEVQYTKDENGVLELKSIETK
ncbi:hypothetical protein [Bacillus sp. HSf4]|uniref:hypothetical protein n=1 Tax=Bacillus sp. HSf4 TaxID=3035514 RepID=UPI0024093E39|nr:hypothetical protein [Bacillus sp. HSf4]WFA04795.1 hypothetical protein P3X63_19800 [Bacillus sp. HSf4]